MPAPPIKSRLVSIAWCVLVPLGVLAAYLGLGLAVVSVVGEPVLGTAVLGGLVALLVGAARLFRPRWFANAPTVRPMSGTPRFTRTVLGCLALAFFACHAAPGGAAGAGLRTHPRPVAVRAAPPGLQPRGRPCPRPAAGRIGEPRLSAADDRGVPRVRPGGVPHGGTRARACTRRQGSRRGRRQGKRATGRIAAGLNVQD